MRVSQAAPVVALIFVLLAAGAIYLLTAGRESNESPTETEKPTAPAPAPRETQPAEAEQQCPFLNDEFLTNPTTNSVTLSVIPAALEKIFVEYDPQPGKYTRKTPAKMVGPDTPCAPVLKVSRVSGPLGQNRSAYTQLRSDGLTESRNYGRILIESSGRISRMAYTATARAATFRSAIGSCEPPRAPPYSRPKRPGMSASTYATTASTATF